MNRKQKLIVSITGITIVMLALLGVTYAYYLTRIEGNTNTNSISVTTANLKLVYSEDTSEIITENNIIPGTTIGEKTFTVTNTGNSTIKNYRVVLELASIEGVVPSVFKYPNDFKITLPCVSKNNTTNNVSGKCNGFNGYWNNETFEMQKNTIDSGIRHEYSLIIEYINQETIDQSDDMGKNLNLKVQIYGENDTSTLNGTITGVDSTYAMKLNSNPKVSTLKPTNNSGEYRYSFTGVEPGEHTLSLIDKDGNVVSSERITITKGTNTNVNGSTITVTDKESTIHLTTNKTGSSISSTATFNPYDNNTNTLAYHIINNAINNTNGTQFLSKPLTIPAVSSSAQKYVKGDDPTSFTSKISSATSYYVTYSDDYTVNEKDGKFTLINKDGSTPITVKYTGTSMADTLKGKYAYWSTIETTAKNVTNISTIYKMSTSTDDFKSSSIKYASVSKEQVSVESILSVTSDDYGTSYYFRGGVIDNYVNFAGMCWKIVRIEGDGSVKLILEDRYSECNNYSFTGNWSGGEEDNYVFGYNDSGKVDFFNYIKTNGLQYSFENFQTNNLTQLDLEKLKIDEWCYDDEVISRFTFCEDYDGDGVNDQCFTDENYGASIRIESNKNPSLNCTGTKLTKYKDNKDMYVGTLTADEMSFAGAYLGSSNFYLINNYAKDNYLNFWSLSPFALYEWYGGGVAFVLNYEGVLFNELTNVNGIYSRPAVTLKSGSIISEGDGTQSNPYVIE